MHVLVCYNLKRACIEYPYAYSNRQKGRKGEVESARPTVREIYEQLERLNQLAGQYHRAQTRSEKIMADQRFYLLYRWFREHTIPLAYSASDDIWNLKIAQGHSYFR
jgi:hypothetical protein